MSRPELFASPAALSTAFVAGLERQLAESGLGTYILTLANACYDTAIWPALATRLEARFQKLAEAMRGDLRSGLRLAYPEDDQMVFLKLMVMGFEAVGCTERRTVGPWAVQFNPLRALRPARASGVKSAGVVPPAFNPDGFHFNKAFLRPEILWEGPLLRHHVRLLYNKFPFAPLHGLLVPEPERARPQLLDQEMHLFAWHLAESLGAGLPDLAIGYNSFGAHASVNHLHFQFCLPERRLPVLSGHWRHNGGDQDYPVVCQVFESPLDAWFYLDALHRQGIPYNLLYTPDRLHCLPRRPQGSRPGATWTTGHAWYEMAGGVTTVNRDDFNQLTAAAIAEELGGLAPVFN